MIQLREYQELIATDAAKLLEFCGIAYLAMQMRTGKTLTALAAADKLLQEGDQMLFVTKKKAIQSIQNDYAAAPRNYAISVTNFEQLHNFPSVYKLVVVDEAHSIGGYPKPSERTKQLKRICANSPMVLYLSGTPTPESYSQLYHQLYITRRSPFASYTNFYKWANEFVTIGKKYFYGQSINDYSNAKKELIEQHTKHLFISYTQEEAGFKQKTEDEILYVRMQKGTYWLADKIKKDRVYIGKAGEEIVADTAAKLMSKLHQIYSGTIIADDGSHIIFDRSKASFISDFFAGQKIAIFYRFRAEEQMLINTFGERITYDPYVYASSADKIFISQFQSGSEGVNLSSADCLVMLNIDFSSKNYQQARDRLQSKDRIKPAKCYWIFAENGIEDKIYKAVQGKQDYTLSYFKKDYRIKDKVKNTQI